MSEQFNPENFIKRGKDLVNILETNGSPSISINEEALTILGRVKTALWVIKHCDNEFLVYFNMRAIESAEWQYELLA
jgi:hypothetical protein